MEAELLSPRPTRLPSEGEAEPLLEACWAPFVWLISAWGRALCAGTQGRSLLPPNYWKLCVNWPSWLVSLTLSYSSCCSQTEPLYYYVLKPAAGFLPWAFADTFLCLQSLFLYSRPPFLPISQSPAFPWSLASWLKTQSLGSSLAAKGGSAAV